MCKASLEAGVTAVGRAIQGGRHGLDPLVFRMHLEPAPNAAVATGRSDSARFRSTHSPSPFRTDSTIAPVGHVSAHAPQDTHAESRNPSSIPAAMFASKPRPTAVRAKVPW